MHSSSRIVLLYDCAMCALALLAIVTLVVESRTDLSPEAVSVFGKIDMTIWGVFVVDYFARFVRADDKRTFVRTNVVELLAILPYDYMFSGLRVLRAGRILRTMQLLRLLQGIRIFVYFARLHGRLRDFLDTNGFRMVLWCTLAMIFLGAVFMEAIENMPFGDALWWSFVTTATVGYGDIAPSSFGGRAVAVVLMVFGIGFLSMLTGTIATFFLRDDGKGFREECLESIVKRLRDLDSLSSSEVDDLCATIRALHMAKRAAAPEGSREAARRVMPSDGRFTKPARCRMSLSPSHRPDLRAPKADNRRIHDEERCDMTTTKRRTTASDPVLSADLFCGAGGLSLGFAAAGCASVFAVEHDSACARTYRANFSGAFVFERDIEDIGTFRGFDALSGRAVGLVIGGPPCQGFSSLGKMSASEEPSFC